MWDLSMSFSPSCVPLAPPFDTVMSPFLRHVKFDSWRRANGRECVHIIAIGKRGVV